MIDMTMDEYISIRKADPRRTLVEQIMQAKHIAKTLGYYTAARFLCKRRWSIQAACWILLKKDARIAG